ncbi:MAG TPA: ATP-binding protein [Chloroflexota bacterium]|nr:ATP-binding protein [Chloroflexota bacterium]HUM68238.1 ATP-binding protein [Chloroflexota bacterium]
MAKEFIGRREELKLLDRLWNSSDSELIILYGRRRVGKTRLLTHWINQRVTPRPGLYWMAEPTSAVDQLRSFSQALANYSDPDEPAPLDFTYANWEQALRQVSLLAGQQRMALFIDEITYLMDINPDIIGTLQKVWDHRLKESNILLVLSGSHMGVIEKKLLSYRAPLYGRATTTMKLQPLPYGVTKEYFPEYSPIERVKVYAIWGGVPAYWERIDPTESVMQNLRAQLQPSNSWMVDEPRLLLQDFLTDMYNYVGIMRAMAMGAQTLKEIGDRNGLSSTHMSSYLSILRDTEFVERIVPVTQREMESRLGRYIVTDPYLRFYYRFLAAYQSKLALGQQQEVLRTIETNLPEFIESNTWREICHEWLVRASDRGELPIPILAVGGEWKRSFEVDVVGIDEGSRSLVLGSTYWRQEPMGVEAIQELVQKTVAIIPRNESWRVYYVGFSASGWTAPVRERAEAILAASKSRNRWEMVGIRLLDLTEVDEDLTRWSEEV